MIPRGKLEALCVEHGPVARRGVKVETADLIRGLVYHQLQPRGTMEAHTAGFARVPISESA